VLSALWLVGLMNGCRTPRSHMAWLHRKPSLDCVSHTCRTSMASLSHCGRCCMVSILTLPIGAWCYYFITVLHDRCLVLIVHNPALRQRSYPKGWVTQDNSSLIHASMMRATTQTVSVLCSDNVMVTIHVGRCYWLIQRGKPCLRFSSHVASPSWYTSCRALTNWFRVSILIADFDGEKFRLDYSFGMALMQLVSAKQARRWQYSTQCRQLSEFVQFCTSYIIFVSKSDIFIFQHSLDG